MLKLPGLEIANWSSATGEATFPYIPGLLSFRETPILLEAWKVLDTEPSVVMMDGQGLAHPRRFGLACHFGVLVNKPCFGCGKTPFVGEFQEPGPAEGCYELIIDEGDPVGAVVRTKQNTAPVYVSAGHLIDLEGSIALTLDSVRVSPVRSRHGAAHDKSAVGRAAMYRIPEPTRLANIVANALRRGDTVEDVLRVVTTHGK